MELNRRVKRLKQRKAAHVADEDAAAVLDCCKCPGEDTHQVVKVGEVLNHRVDHNGVELLGSALKFMSGFASQRDIGQAQSWPMNLFLQKLNCCGRHVGAAEELGLGRDPE